MTTFIPKLFPVTQSESAKELKLHLAVSSDSAETEGNVIFNTGIIIKNLFEEIGK